MNLCKCGCGQEVKKKFVKGHHRRSIPHTKKSKALMSQKLTGRNISENTKILISQKNKGKIPWNKGGTSWNKGIKWTEETRERIRETKKKNPQIAWNKGLNWWSKEIREKIMETKRNNPYIPTEEHKLKTSQSLRKISVSSRFKKGYIPWNKDLTMKNDKRVKKYRDSRNKTIKEKGVFNSIEYKNLQSEVSKKKWKRAEYVQNQMKSRGVSPNKLEKNFEKLLNKLYPKEWKFVGDGKLIINGKCPDFVNINGKKKLIELYGNYWHRTDDPEDRKKEFKLFGWDTLILWEKDIKKNPDLKRIINNFINDRKLLRRTTINGESNK